MSSVTARHGVQRRRGQQGMALVLVLWVLSLLTVMAGSFALGMRREAAIITGVKNNAQAVAIAEAGIAIAEMMLLNPDENKRWRTDGSIYQIDTAGGATVRIRLLSEMGKIDINTASEKLLQGLMANVPEDENNKDREAQSSALANAIIDWRDEDNLVHLDGAEEKQYQDAGLKYRPRNKPFQTIEELQLVLGMNGAIFRWVEPLITVYSGQSSAVLPQASREVLQVMPELDAGLIEGYIADRLESAKNDLPPPAFPLSSGQSSAAGQNEALTVISEAQLEDGSTGIISAIIKKSEDSQNESPVSSTAPFQALKWQRNTTSSPSLFTEAMSEFLVKQYAEFEINN